MLGLRLLSVVAALTALVAGALIVPVAGSAPAGSGAAAAAAASWRADCGGERPPKPGGGRYRCTFEDDFSGSSLDTGKWVVQETALTGVSTGTRGCYINDPSTVSVRGGVVRLTTRRAAMPFLCKSPYGSFWSTERSATIGSWGTFSQAYGRFEFRAKFPDHSGPGFGSGLWLYPQVQAYGTWPHSGEIDVAERFSGQPNQVYPSVHYAGEVWQESTGFNCMVSNPGKGFHRYAVEWTRTTMTFEYDGRTCFTHSWTPDAPLRAPQPFDRPFYLVMTQVFGNGWNAPTWRTPTIGQMQVDWVRAWS